MFSTFNSIFNFFSFLFCFFFYAFFFFQAEDGIRDRDVTGVQTCALPISLEIAEVLIRSGAVDVLVVDSVAALVPRAELEGEMGDAQMGMQARLMSQALRKRSEERRVGKECRSRWSPEH